MDLDEVKTCIRALVSSTAFSYHLNNLLNDFKNMTGLNLPLFGYLHPVEFLKTINDTVQLLGDPYNPEIALVKNKKSAHIISLVDRQKTKPFGIKNSHFANKPKRIVLPSRNELVTHTKGNKFVRSDVSFGRNFKQMKTSLPPLMPEGRLFNSSTNSKLRYATYSSKTYTEANVSNQQRPVIPLLEVKVNPLVLEKRNNHSNQVSNSTSSLEPKIQTKKPLTESPDVEKTDSCYFEDVSDNEISPSIEESRSSSGQAASASCCFINDGIKNKLKKIIQNYPKGLWCCELPGLFLQEFNFVLDYREFGYTSLIQMLSELPDVFRCIRPGNEDWILFDASVPPSPEEKKMMDLQLTGDINCKVRTNILRFLFNYLEKSSDSGIEMDKILDLYEKMFGSCLDLQALGFKDIKSLLETWEGRFLNLLKINGKVIVVPVSKLTARPPKKWQEAVPPVTPENDLFAEIFPKEVVGPDESLPQLDLACHVAVGQVVEVCIAEVWSPSKFYLQLNKFKCRLNRFMDDLQKFYNVHLSKYKMPDSTIRANQVCVGLYNSEPDYPEEWHRAQIVKVINEKLVLINFVDFGTVTRVRKSQLRFMHRNFYSLPIQAFSAELSGIIPPNDENKWPMSTSKKFLQLLRVPYLDAELVDIDFKKPFMSVILFDSLRKSAVSINKKLVLEKLARAKESETVRDFLFKEPETEANSPENGKKAFYGNSSVVSVQENLSKNLSEITDEFSDVADLGPATLFYFKMKSLKLENSSTYKAKNEPCREGVSYEFEEVPDLETNEKEIKVDERKGETESAILDVAENQKSSDSASLCLKEAQSLSSPTVFEEGLSDLKFLKPGMNNPESQSSSLSAKPKRLPPGLEHINILPNFNEIQLLIQPEDLKKTVNALAMEFLTTSSGIKQVGLSDPALALKIATEMAEAYISSDYSRKLSYCLNPQLENSFMPKVVQKLYEGEEPDMPVAPVLPVVPSETKLKASETTDNISSEQISSMTKPATKEKKENEYVRPVEINGKNLHLVKIDNEYYFCAEEVVRNFSLISSREIADKVLHIKKIYFDYKIICRKTDSKILNALKSSDLPTVKKKSKKLKIYLIPLPKVVSFLQALGCQTRTFENEFIELLRTEKEDIERKKSILS